MLQKELAKEIKRRVKPKRRLLLPYKKQITKWVKQNKSTEAIKKYLEDRGIKVSKRTLYRQFKAWKLKGIRKKGRKKRIKLPPPPPPKDIWIKIDKYFDNLNKQFHFVNIGFRPNLKYINTLSLVCSNRKANPKGKFTTISIWFIVRKRGRYYLLLTSHRYSDEPVNFNEIFSFAEKNALDIAYERIRGLEYDKLIGVVALSFRKPSVKERVMEMFV